MPQIIVRYSPKLAAIIEDDLHELGLKCRKLVAEAASTPEVPFTTDDIEWITQPYGPGSSGVQNVSVEIRTIGRPERKAKLNKQRLLQLKQDFREAGFHQYMGGADVPLIWMQFVDVEGAHV